MLAERHGLVEADLGRVPSPSHTYADFGRPIAVVTNIGKSRRLGFLDDRPTDDASFDLSARLLAKQVIP